MYQLQHFVTPWRKRLTTIQCLEPKAWTNVETKNHTLPTNSNVRSSLHVSSSTINCFNEKKEDRKKRAQNPINSGRKALYHKLAKLILTARVVQCLLGQLFLFMSMGVRLCLWSGLLFIPRWRRWGWDVSERAYSSSSRWRRWGWDCLWTGLLFIPQMTSMGWDYVSELAYCSSPRWRRWGEIMSLNGPILHPPDDVDGVRLCLWTGILFIPQMTSMGWDYVSELAYCSSPRCHAYGEPQWNNTDGRKPKNLGKDLFRRHSAHRKSRMGWLGCEPWHPG
jgi:hypothetical protein